MRKECRILQHIADDLFIMSEYPPSSCDFKSEQSSAKTLTLVKISTNLRYLIFVSTCIFSLFLKLCLILTKTATVLLITGMWAVFCGNSVYCTWCGVYQQKCWNESRHQRKFIFRNFDFVFLHEKFLLISNLPLCFFI